MKLSPPSGVIAPNTFNPVTVNRYKLPENKIIPAKNRINGHFNDNDGTTTANTPINNNPNA